VAVGERGDDLRSGKLDEARRQIERAATSGDVRAAVLDARQGKFAMRTRSGRRARRTRSF